MGEGAEGWAVWVVGEPAPKGSLRCLGGRHVDDNPKTRRWMRQIRDSVTASGWAGQLPGPVSVHIDVWFARPGTHFGSGRNAGVVKSSAPTRHASRPDADKVARAVLDALGPTRHRPGIVLRDDAQVAQLTIRKRWCDEDFPNPCAWISWRPL